MQKYGKFHARASSSTPLSPLQARSLYLSSLNLLVFFFFILFGADWTVELDQATLFLSDRLDQA